MNAPLLVELFTEELPPRALARLSESFAAAIAEGLRAAHLAPAHVHLGLQVQPQLLARDGLAQRLLQRELVAGISQHYEPQDIIGKTIVMLANLEPRKIRGIVSEGMILCAHDEGKLSILLPERNTKPGSVIS